MFQVIQRLMDGRYKLTKTSYGLQKFLQLMLYLKNNNAWAESGRIEFEASDLKVKVETWNGDLSNQKIRKILGFDRVATAFVKAA